MITTKISNSFIKSKYTVKKLNVVIIGLGNIGFEYDIKKHKRKIETYSRAFYQNKKFKLIAGVDKNKSKISNFQKKYYSLGFSSIKELKKKINKVDVFIISTPHHNHLECAKEKILSSKINCL